MGYNPLDMLGSALSPVQAVPGTYDLRNALQAAAYGKAPSAAEQQMRMAQNNNVAQQYALARSQPGLAPAMAARQAAMGAADVGAQQAGQYGALRAQEQATARGQLGQFLQGQQQLANQQRQQNLDMLGGIAQGGMSLLSDERAKTDVHQGDHEAEGLLNALHAYRYNYKDPDQAGAAHGKQLGVMAQDVDRAPGGHQMVDEGADGLKHLDANKAIGPILASLAHLHGRLKALEHGKHGGR